MRLQAAAAVLLTCGVYGATAYAVYPTGAPDDHFLCYQAEQGGAKFTPVPGATLDDGHQPITFDVTKPVSICNPASSNGSPITTTSGVGLVTSAAILDVQLPAPFGLADLNAALILKGQ